MTALALHRNERLLPALLGLLGVLGLLAGCLSDGGTAPAGGGSAVGGWAETSGASCRQGLAFEFDGRFSFAIRLTTAGLTLARRLEGSFTATAPGGTEGLLDTASTVSPDAVVYCAQWHDATRTALPFDDVAAQTGIDPAALSYRALLVPGQGPLLVGTDTAADVDRLGFHRDAGGTLHGFLFAGHLPAGVALHHRAPLELPADFVSDSLGPAQAVNLPQQAYSRRFSASAADETLAQLLLNVHTAADVTFSAVPGTGAATCRFVIYETTDFLPGTQLVSSPLSPTAATQTVAFNPGDPDHFFVEHTTSEAGQSVTAYLVPLAVEAPDAGECEANIRARPLAARLLEERIADGGPADVLTAPAGTGRAALPARHGAAPGRLLFGSLARTGAPWQGLALQPRLVALPALGADDGGVPDVLALAAPTVPTVGLSVTRLGGHRFLSLFPTDGSRLGLGPFSAYEPPPQPLPLALPDTVDETLAAGDLQRTYRLTLATARRVAFETANGLDTRGVLRDARGRALAHDADGAADGAGFRIVRTLPAGGYDLAVTAAEAGSYRLAVAEEPPGAVADEALEACLIAAGTARLPAGSIFHLLCPGAGVASLQGLGTYGALVSLVLDGNAVADLSPLAALVHLQRLSLARNPVGDLSPLTGLPALHRLSLAGVRLDAAHLAVLAALGDRLTWLDLRAATGLSETDAQALKADLPNTTLVTPAGTVLP